MYLFQHMKYKFYDIPELGNCALAETNATTVNDTDIICFIFIILILN